MRISDLSWRLTIAMLFLAMFTRAQTVKKIWMPGADTAIKGDWSAVVRDIRTALQAKKVDTIIDYKRTCIGCCDFQNFFWKHMGRWQLSKVYFDVADFKIHVRNVELRTPDFSQLLPKMFDSLQQGAIREAGILIDHYCYSKITIHAGNKKISSGEMRDVDLQRFATVEANNFSESARNPFYRSNSSSGWSVLLKALEKTVAGRTETPPDEREHRRINR